MTFLHHHQKEPHHNRQHTTTRRSQHHLHPNLIAKQGSSHPNYERSKLVGSRRRTRRSRSTLSLLCRGCILFQMMLRNPLFIIIRRALHNRFLPFPHIPIPRTRLLRHHSLQPPKTQVSSVHTNTTNTPSDTFRRARLVGSPRGGGDIRVINKVRHTTDPRSKNQIQKPSLRIKYTLWRIRNSNSPIMRNRLKNLVAHRKLYCDTEMKDAGAREVGLDTVGEDFFCAGGDD